MAASEDEKFLPTDLPKELPSGLEKNSYGPHEVRTLLSWTAPGRPYIKRSKQFYVNALLIMLPIEIILFLFSQYMLMVVVVALVFLGFTFSLVPPRDYHYKITSEGIRIEEHFYLWHELYDFYFIRKEGLDTLFVRTVDFLPGLLTITLGDLPKDHVRQVLLPYLPYREVVKPTFMDKSGDWLSKNFPLERAT